MFRIYNAVHLKKGIYFLQLPMARFVFTKSAAGNETTCHDWLYYMDEYSPPEGLDTILNYYNNLKGIVT